MRNPAGFQRTLVDNTTYTGQVVQWNANRGFGWVRPDTPLPMGTGNEGRVFVHWSDIVASGEGMRELKPDSKVEFVLYTDRIGLGAAMVTGAGGHPIKTAGGRRRRLSQVTNKNSPKNAYRPHGVRNPARNLAVGPWAAPPLGVN